MVNILTCEKALQTLRLQSFCLVRPRGIEPPARGLGMWSTTYFNLIQYILAVDI